MITLSVGIAITLLMGFHLYLTLSAQVLPASLLAFRLYSIYSCLARYPVIEVGGLQTTIEFYGNRVKAFRARRRGEVWSNPYDLGYRRNWQHVFGPGNVALALLPRSVFASSQRPGLHTYRTDACTTVRVAAGSQAFRRILAKIFGRAALVSGTFSASEHGARI